MRIAIGKPTEVGGEWTPFPNDPFMHPHEIRVGLHKMLDSEEAPDAPELSIVTLNRTVLDQVGMEGTKRNPRITYENVFVWDGDKLVPLLDIREDIWLVHFSLGDLFDRCDLDSWRVSLTQSTP